MNKSILRILVTGAGAPGIRGTLYALRNNPDNVTVYVVGTDIKKDVVGRFFVDHFYQIPKPENENYIDKLIDIVKKEAINIIIPQTTREVFVLSNHKDELASLNVHIMCSSSDTLKVANNKARLLKVFEKLKLPHPKYRISSTEKDLINAAQELGYPERLIVVKPPISNGMRGFRVLKENAWDADRFLREKPSGVEISLDHLLNILKKGKFWPELLITEYLPGPEYSVDAFIGEHINIAIPRLRKSIRSGISFENTIEFRKDISDLTLEAGKHIGLRYAFGFQFKLDENGTPKVLECNPRVQGTMVASVFSGVNIIWLSIRELLGKPVKTINAQLKESSFYRYWGGIGVLDDRVYEI